MKDVRRTPPGAEDIYKIYVESFKDEAHLLMILHQAQGIVDVALADGSTKSGYR